MKGTGIVRRVDELGRLVLPAELRRTLNMDELQPLEIFVDGENIVLRKYTPGCSLCGHTETPMVNLYPQKPICTGCVDVIVNSQDSLKRTAEGKFE
ncbi:AbrB/MazE/SpoVT family DNA-binding domain-containing protein [Brevibacillus reuszeri]|uniref:AbrB/MazE/SpoVT family DNA-binding domain-containing protein n=1 Tax=Brevibacillus reuszeri TaxID=54915 RepID=UPI00289ADA93|nr:AbrB/MazE/SpoVT family DNA-binding domain-containing protein [Brevibacillus reuszeri]